MKRAILAVFLMAGVALAGGPITPPGVQINGLATNNNVMVYSDGALIDSGVAPTNLVSVTNLTADIAANTASVTAANTTNSLQYLKTESDARFTARAEQLSTHSKSNLHILVVAQSNYEPYSESRDTSIALPVELQAGVGVDNAWLCYLGSAIRFFPYTTDPLEADYAKLQHYGNASAYHVTPDTWMGYVLSKEYDNVRITKAAVGGTSITNWLKSGGTYYPRITQAYADMQVLSSTNAGLADIILWGQGENDASSYAGHRADFDQMISDLRADFCVSNAPVIISGMGELYKDSAIMDMFRDFVSDNPQSILVDASDLGTNSVHYIDSETRTLGYRLASAVQGVGTSARGSGVYAGGAGKLGFSEGIGESIVTRTSQTIDSTAVNATISERVATRNVIYDQYKQPAGSGFGEAWIYQYDILDMDDLFGSTGTGVDDLARVKGALGTSVSVNYSRSVPLVYNSKTLSSATTWEITMSSAGKFVNDTDLRAFKTRIYQHSSSGNQTDLYGAPQLSSDSFHRWIVTFNEALTIAAGDTVQCGADTYFICDEALTAGTNMVVREHWNPSDNGSGYTPVSTNTPVIIAGVTNATAQVTASNLPSNYLNSIYANSLGWYIVPRYYSSSFYEVVMPVADGWTPSNGL